MVQDRRLLRSVHTRLMRRIFATASVLCSLSLLALVLGGVVPSVAEDEQLPSFIDTPTPVPEPPTQKQIQKAVMRCLSSADSSRAASRRNPRGLGMAEEGEERYCFEQKKECQKDAGGFACRSFIRDYVTE